MLFLVTPFAKNCAVTIETQISENNVTTINIRSLHDFVTD